MQPDVALFAGGATSLEWAPKFAAAGTTVIGQLFGLAHGSR